MTAKITLPEMLNSRGAVHLKDLLGAELDKDVELDFAAVRHIGAQALQILISAQKTWLGAGKAFAYSGISADLLSRIEAMGGRAHLELEG